MTSPAVCHWTGCDRVLDRRNRSGVCRVHWPAWRRGERPPADHRDRPDPDDTDAVLSWLQVLIVEMLGQMADGSPPTVALRDIDYGRKSFIAVIAERERLAGGRPGEDDVLDRLSAALDRVTPPA